MDSRLRGNDGGAAALGRKQTFSNERLVDVQQWAVSRRSVMYDVLG